MAETSYDVGALQPALKAEADRIRASGCFDSVFIIVTGRFSDDSAGAHYLGAGSGNGYASRGAMREWLVCDDEETRENARRCFDGD